MLFEERRLLLACAFVRGDNLFALRPPGTRRLSSARGQRSPCAPSFEDIPRVSVTG